MTLFMRRSLFAFVLGAALATAVLFGRAAHATDATIEACFKPSNGTLYLLGGGSGRTECQSGDIPISWNTAGVNGQDGADGVSVTSDALGPGEDPACPNGGSKFTSANGVSYACNGAGGQDGQDGEDFAGTFTSPNGNYSLSVDDNGARLEGPFGRIRLSNNGAKVEGLLGSLELTPAANSLQSSSNLMLQSSGLLTVGGTQISLNGNGCGILRPTDIATAVGPDGGPILFFPGSISVRTGC